MSKPMRVARLLAQANFKPGDQAPEGYFAWHEWAEVQHKAGLRQKECGECGLWRYPQELSGETIRWQSVTARGKRVNQMAPVCLKCVTPNVGAKATTEARSAGSGRT